MIPPEFPAHPGRVSPLAGLNPAQREAVDHGEGPALVLAGAGSGKTRVITHRIAHLIDRRDVPPWRIVAVTFTNKAAAEMRERVEGLVGASRLGAWIGTFHAYCLRILRRHGEQIGLRPGFNIYDTTDQLALVRRLLKEESAEDTSLSARPVLSAISRAKSNLQGPEEMERRAFTPDRKLTARIYVRYQEALHRTNAVDFDDLLLRTLDLFREHADVLREYTERILHLLVDEYQDTNRPQYLLVKALSSAHHNLFVVGDEDQSIYRFRGAEIRNILDFEEDHPDARVFRLEQNYRSTGNILDAAGAVISRNVNRKGKTLWTENPEGERVDLYNAPDDRGEADWISARIRSGGDPEGYDDIAVLYRTNAQSRQLEEIFRRDDIPYQVVGSVQFYERKEIKDLLAYLKLAANPADDVSFRRIVNVPARGIGATTLQAVEHVARSLGLPLMEAAGHAVEEKLLSTRPGGNLGRFLDFMVDLLDRSGEGSVEDLLEHVIEATGFEEYLEKSYPGQGYERMENVRGLISAAVEYAEEAEDPSLLGFLDRSALVSDADDVGVRPGVTLMTIHCAKGLEFREVYLVGLEENLFPHMRSVGSEEDLEEERRLCYVAMTRARERLVLSHADIRRSQGTFLPNPPSRFLEEIPSELLHDVTPGAAFRTRERTVRLPSEPVVSNGSSAARVSLIGGASLAHEAAPARKGKDPGDGLAVGARIRHPKFGTGRILNREGKGKGLKLTIRFNDHGRKKILPAYTRLQVES